MPTSTPVYPIVLIGSYRSNREAIHRAAQRLRELIPSHVEIIDFTADFEPIKDEADLKDRIARRIHDLEMAFAGILVGDPGNDSWFEIGHLKAQSIPVFGLGREAALSPGLYTYAIDRWFENCDALVAGIGSGFP